MDVQFRQCKIRKSGQLPLSRDSNLRDVSGQGRSIIALTIKPELPFKSAVDSRKNHRLQTSEYYGLKTLQLTEIYSEHNANFYPNVP